MDLFQIHKVKDLKQQVKELEDKLEDEQNNLRSVLKRNDFLESELKKTEDLASNLQEFMITNIEGKALARYARPEVLAVISKYESLNNELKRKNDELDYDRKKFEVEKDLYRRNYEIEILSKYTNQKDTLLSMLATKQPIQNMMLEKRDARDPERWDR